MPGVQSVREKNRKRRPRKNALGCPSQNEISNTGVSKRSHDENIRVARRNIRAESRVNAGPAASTVSRTTSSPWRAKCLASSAPDRLVSITFSLATVTTHTRFALCSIGRASATARAAGRLKSQATTTVSIANAPARFGAGGMMSVGRPEPNMIDSAYHCSKHSSSGTGTIVRSRRRACSMSTSGTSDVRQCSSIRSWKTPRFSAASWNAAKKVLCVGRTLLGLGGGHRRNVEQCIAKKVPRDLISNLTCDSRNSGSNGRSEIDGFVYCRNRRRLRVGRERKEDILDGHFVSSLTSTQTTIRCRQAQSEP